MGGEKPTMPRNAGYFDFKQLELYAHTDISHNFV